MTEIRRRAEFKTPGGKLIAVEFEVRDQVLHDVTITGDFFLYPEEALPVLAQALEGMPITLDEAELAARVQMALDEGIELLGSSPQAIAAAVTRARSKEIV
jgi:lipoate-protein ligase A